MSLPLLLSGNRPKGDSKCPNHNDNQRNSLDFHGNDLTNTVLSPRCLDRELDAREIRAKRDHLRQHKAGCSSRKVHNPDCELSRGVFVLRPSREAFRPRHVLDQHPGKRVGLEEQGRVRGDERWRVLVDRTSSFVPRSLRYDVVFRADPDVCFVRFDGPSLVLS